MKHTRRVPQSWIRWTSLCACFSISLTSLVLFPARITSVRAGLPGQQENETSNGKARKVRAKAPRSGPPNGILPNLDEARLTNLPPPKAPAAVPSTGRRRGRGHRQGARLTNVQKDRALLASASLPAKRREMKAEVSSSSRRGNDSQPLSDSTAKLFPGTTSTAEPLPQSPSTFAMARLAPGNRTGTGGEDLLSNNFNWSLPLVGLKGRGLDLGLSLSYNSLVWTRAGNDIDYDLDEGSIAPGFRLGFPTVEGPYSNDQVGTNFYLLVTPEGRRVELRLTATTNVYEAADSSHLQLIDYGSSLLVRPTDGMQMNFVTANSTWRCNQIKDRNGNFLTINYNSGADIANITDTLGRVVTFNYDGNANLISISQTWNGQTHYWATFGWGSAYVGYNFPGLTSYGPDGSYVPVLTQVGLADGSHYNFEYNNSYGMVSTIRHYASDNHQVGYTTYVTPSSSSDCPRLTERRDWAENWNGVNGVPSEVVTYFAHEVDGACRMTAPDGTVYQEYYGASWQSGLTTQSEVWSGGVRQKWTSVAWTQDNPSVGYLTNPRVTETNVYDAQGNRRRRTIEYGSYAQWSLPYLVREYAADGLSQIKHSFTDYLLNQSYLDRRIIGLVSVVHISNTAWFETKISYHYDDAAQIQATPATTIQHDASFGTSFLARGNLTAIARWDITDSSTINDGNKALTSRVGYDTNGSPVWSKDPLDHQSSISYADSFSDGNNSRNTFAYPTTTTNADGFSSAVQYNFDFGALTRTQGPPPAGQSQGAIHAITYDSAARLQQMTIGNNGAYTRYVYGPNYVQSFSTVNTVADEAYAIQVFDGVGRVIGAVNNHPGSSGGYRLINTIYDSMGRAKSQSNPAEINSSWSPTGDDAAGLLYTQQTYDWKGRRLVTTNPDGTQKYASYGGCGCAGGEVVTLTDEVGRQQKAYSDVLGRAWKSEVLNWNGTVYSTTTNTFNARDQVALIRQWAGAENGGGAYQDTTMSYDGYGRLKTKHVPEQDSGTYTSWDYYADDTIQKVTDARGAYSTLTYNNRHLVTHVSFTPAGGVPDTPDATFSYDAAGNRTSTTDGVGTMAYSYNQLSQMTSETRTFTGLTGSYQLSYGYNLAGQVTSLSEPSQFGAIVNYAYDTAERLSNVTASGMQVSSLMTGLQYRASGALKHAEYGDGTQLNLSYNNRLLLTRYELNNVYYTTWPPAYVTMGSQNSYFDDGRVRYTQDLHNGNFDRGYSFDHAGRLEIATSGREARGEAPANPADSPYKQTFSYDAWGNMGRTGRLWSEGQGDTPTYTNNRRADWTYDAEGHAVSGGWHPFRTQDYDVAGQQVNVYEESWSGPWDAWVFHQNTIEQVYAGDGQPGKRVETRHSEDYQGTIINDVKTVYFLRSSVLGGATVAEIYPSGEREGHVYAGGEKIADYQESPPYGVMDFRHANPANGNWINVHIPGNGGTRTEFDPLGATVGIFDPFPSQLSYNNMVGNEFLYSELGNPFDLGGGCGRLDGMPVSCSELNMRMEAGTVEAEFPGISINGRNGRVTARQPIRSHGVGLFSVWLPDGSRGNDSQWDLHFFVVPQNSRAVPLQSAELLRKEFKKLLSDPDCKEFVEGVIREAESKVSESQRLNMGFEDLFENIAYQGGYVLQDNLSLNRYPISGAVVRSETSIDKGNAQVLIRTRHYYTTDNPRVIAERFAAQRRNYLASAFHETFHHIGRISAAFSDEALGRAAFKLTGDTGGLPGGSDVLQWSSYFDNQLMKKCMPDMVRSGEPGKIK